MESEPEDVRVTLGSDNVFADLGLPNADMLLARTDLAIAVKKIVDEHGWTKAEAAERTFLTVEEVTLLMRCRLSSFSIERLQTVLRNIGVDVTIALRRRDDGDIGTLSVLKPD